MLVLIYIGYNKTIGIVGVIYFFICQNARMNIV